MAQKVCIVYISLLWLVDSLTQDLWWHRSAKLSPICSRFCQSASLCWYCLISSSSQLWLRSLSYDLHHHYRLMYWPSMHSAVWEPSRMNWPWSMDTPSCSPGTTPRFHSGSPRELWCRTTATSATSSCYMQKRRHIAPLEVMNTFSHSNG